MAGQYLGFDPHLQSGLGTLHLENSQLVAQRLEEILRQPHQFYCKERLLGNKLRRITPQSNEFQPPQAVVRIGESYGVDALMVADSHYEPWEVPVGSGFFVIAGKEAYFLTPAGNEYLVRVEEG